MVKGHRVDFKIELLQTNKLKESILNFMRKAYSLEYIRSVALTHQSTGIIEALIAVLADVGLGGLVLALVAAQVGGHGGAEPALVATERLLACVLAHVDFQVAGWEMRGTVFSKIC